MNLRNMLCERVHAQKVTYYMIPPVVNIQIGESIKTEQRLMVIRK